MKALDQEREDNADNLQSDSEDDSDSASSSSNVDSDEYERLRVDCLKDLIELEHQFKLLKKTLYEERLQQVNALLVEVRAGVSNEYQQKLKAIEDQFTERTHVASVLHDMQMQCISSEHQSEELAAAQSFEYEKQRLFDAIKAELEEKIVKLELDKKHADLNLAEWMKENSSQRKDSKQSAKSAQDAANRVWARTFDVDIVKKPVAVNGPCVVYMLRDEEIDEDWQAIRSAAHDSY